MLLTTLHHAAHLGWVDPAAGLIARVEVGDAPWGLVVDRRGRAYVATDRGLAIVDIDAQEMVAFVPYRTQVHTGQRGEHREGGMGVAVAADGSRVFVGVYVAQPGASRLEVIDPVGRTVLAAVPIGDRPFDVVVAADASEAYSVDHDGFSITAVDATTFRPRTIPVAPLGRDPFAKPHYAAVANDGTLDLPFQGTILAVVDPRTGDVRTASMQADSHQHGVSLAVDGRLFIVGTGAAGDAERGPNLTILGDTERVIPLDRPHEAVSVDVAGGVAYLTGGYTLTDGGGWDGITAVLLADASSREIAVPGRPLDIEVLLPP